MKYPSLEKGFTPHISEYPKATGIGFACLFQTKPEQKTRLCAGFTLIEVLIAMVLLTAGLLTLLSVTLGGMLQREVSREYDIARNAAYAKIEEIRAQDFSDVPDYHNVYFPVTDLTPPTGWTDPCKVEVDSSVSDLYEVTVTVRWRIQGNANPDVYNEYLTMTLLTRRSKY
ncbi:MAG: prepilin-type N-terminal cleavage/methylation domain-containing protein [Planctomycetota bacterium]